MIVTSLFLALALCWTRFLKADVVWKILKCQFAQPRGVAFSRLPFQMLPFIKQLAGRFGNFPTEFLAPGFPCIGVIAAFLRPSCTALKKAANVAGGF